MNEGSIKESGPHDELMRIEIEKDASGNMVKGWYRDLYETQHGKSDKEDPSNTEVLKAELDSTKQMLNVLKEENTRLRTEQVESRKLELGKRIDRILDEVPLQLNLTRHITETVPYCSHDENVPPMRLTLDRARTS